MVWTIKHHLWKLCAPVQPSRHQPSGSRHSKPYYGNYVQPKCNCPDARVTPFRRGLVIEAFSTTLERRLQLIICTLGQAVRTPSGILVITFYSNIGLGRNRCHWKANKKFCKLMVRAGIRLSTWKHQASGWPCRIFQNWFSDTETVAHPDGQGYGPNARARDSDSYLF
jgi:hypothetical protein